MKDNHPEDGMLGYAARDVVTNSILSHIGKDSAIYDEITDNIDKYVDAYLQLYQNMIEYKTENDRNGYLLMCNIVTIALANCKKG